ncbi:hypothetical protein D3C84_897490 [compost metagenome]
MNRTKVFFNPSAFGMKTFRVDKVVAKLSSHRVKERTNIPQLQVNGSEDKSHANAPSIRKKKKN